MCPLKLFSITKSIIIIVIRSIHNLAFLAIINSSLHIRTRYSFQKLNMSFMQEERGEDVKN